MIPNIYFIRTEIKAMLAAALEALKLKQPNFGKMKEVEEQQKNPTNNLVDNPKPIENANEKPKRKYRLGQN